MSSNVTETDALTSSDAQRGAYAWYVLFLLTFVYTVAFIDRQVLNLLVDNIKPDLGLTDTELSLLQGVAFMSAYIAFGPLFGRWADSGNRRNLLVFGVAAWSVCSALCGFADDYWTLFLARAGVGAAEACLSPAAWSLITDYFDRHRLARAMSIYLMGPYIGGGLAMIAGSIAVASMGQIAQAVPVLADSQAWQITFIVVGAPGVLLAAALLTVREPPRGASGAAATPRNFTLAEIASFLWQWRAFYARFMLGMALIVIALYALPAWGPAFLMRRYGADPATVGLQYGALVLITGTIGVLSGPILDRRLAARGLRDSPLRAAVIASIGLFVSSGMLAFMPDFLSALAGLAVATFFYSLPQSMTVTALQLATPNRMRGVVASLYIFVVSVVGLGVAPTVVALVTDRLLQDPARVGESLAIVCAASAAGAAWLLYTALPHYRQALQHAERP